MKKLCVILLCLTLTACASTSRNTAENKLLEQGAIRLDSATIQHTYVGNTLTGKTATGNSFHFYVATNGRLVMLANNKLSEGLWKIDETDLFCITVNAMQNCTREYNIDGRIHSVKPNGTLARTAYIRDGNPEDI